MPGLQQLTDLYGPDQLTLLAVNFKESRAQVLKFAQAVDLQLPLLLDPQGAVAARLQEVFSVLEHQLSSSPRGLAVLRQVQALEAELEAEVLHRSRRIAAA